MKRARTKHFFISGALGGLVGFVLMEQVRYFFPSVGGLASIFSMALQFSVFGLAVGAALGITEAVVQKRYRRMLYGLFLGVVLGAVGGFAGGAVGQTIWQLLPQKPQPETPGADLTIALDASGSMKEEILWIFPVAGNDIDGKRLEAAEKLVNMLGPSDRVAIVSFNHVAQTHIPLTRLDSRRARDQVKRAIKGVGDNGGTNLTAGLQASLAQLTAEPTEQPRHVIFLTDGVGEYHPAVLEPALENDIKIYTIGLGSQIDRQLLESIAQQTGGAYYPVDNADQLWQTFERIYQHAIHVDMAGKSTGDTHDPLLLFLFRMLSWGVAGLVIGLGQGVRENTREDLRACALGGLVGGLVGGAAFDPILSVLGFGGGILGRALAEVTVGACIGGSMRFAQGLVLQNDGPTSSLISILPEKSSSLVMPSAAATQPNSGGQLRASGMKGLMLSVKQAIEQDSGGLVQQAQSPATTSPAAAPSAPAQEELSQPAPIGRRKPLSFFQSRYPNNRPQAMAAAFQSGHYSVSEISEFFEVAEPRVRRAIQQTQ